MRGFLRGSTGQSVVPRRTRLVPQRSDRYGNGLTIGELLVHGHEAACASEALATSNKLKVRIAEITILLNTCMAPLSGARPDCVSRFVHRLASPSARTGSEAAPRCARSRRTRYCVS